jgi:uncharacterized protein YjbI with pentapeptide repeats
MKHTLHTLLLLGLASFSYAEGMDYSGQELPKKDFSNGALDRAKFDNSALQFANFTNATLKKASFKGANLKNANFRAATLDAADFTGANLEGAIFTDAKAWHAIFTGTEIHLARATLLKVEALREKLGRDRVDAVKEIANSDATCGSLSFHYADLRDCHIFGNGEGVDFRDADLRGADLSHVENLDKARLKGVKSDEKTVWKKNPIWGKWLILKEDGGAKEGGTLTLLPDHSFDWSPNQLADPPQILNGNWSEQDGKIEIKDGELGLTWTAKRSLRNGKAELELHNENGAKRTAMKDVPE